MRKRRTNLVNALRQPVRCYLCGGRMPGPADAGGRDICTQCQHESNAAREGQNK